jgi:hypothetical protein
MSGDVTATFAVQLKDETSKPAADATNSLEALRAKMEEDTKALRGMQQALGKLKAGQLGTSDAAKVLKGKIAEQKAAIGKAQQEMINLGGSFTATAKKTEAGGGAMSKFKEVLAASGPKGQALAGVLEGVGAKTASMNIAAVAAAGAFLALAAAIAVAVVALVKYGIATADVRRQEALRLEGMLRLRNAHHVVTASSNELQTAIDGVSSSSALSREQVGSWAESIARTGIRGQQLNEILEVTASTASAAGDAAAARFRDQAIWAARTGQNVSALAGRWRAAFGDIARRQANGLDRQMARLHENFTQLFSGIRLDGFLDGLNKVLSIFSQSSAAGRALKQIITTMFNPSLDAAGQWGDGIADALKRVVLWTIRTYNMWLEFRIAVRDAVRGARRYWHEFVDDISQVSHIADAIVNGLVGRLRAIWGRVTDTARDLAHSLTGVFTDVWEIHSPSRVFANLGEQIPRGITQGINRTAPQASEAAASAIAMPDAPDGGNGARRGAAATTVTFGDVHIHPRAGDTGQSLARDFMNEVASLLEGTAIQIGAAVPT